MKQTGDWLTSNLMFPSPEDDMDHYELRCTIVGAIMVLAPRQRLVVQERVLGDKKFGEIAAMIGVSTSRAQQIFSQAARKLHHSKHSAGLRSWTVDAKCRRYDEYHSLHQKKENK